MKFLLIIESENAALGYDGGEYDEARARCAVAKLLRDAAINLALGNARGGLRDINGNTVGYFELKSKIVEKS